MDTLEALFPKPQRVERRDGVMICPDVLVIYLENEVPLIHPIAERLQRRLTDLGRDPDGDGCSLGAALYHPALGS